MREGQEDYNSPSQLTIYRLGHAGFLITFVSISAHKTPDAPRSARTHIIAASRRLGGMESRLGSIADAKIARAGTAART